MAQAGVSGFDVSNWFGVFVPAGTLAPFVANIQSATKRWAKVVKDSSARAA